MYLCIMWSCAVRIYSMSAWFSRIIQRKVTCVTKFSAVLKHVSMSVARKKMEPHNLVAHTSKYYGGKLQLLARI